MSLQPPWIDLSPWIDFFFHLYTFGIGGFRTTRGLRTRTRAIARSAPPPERSVPWGSPGPDRPYGLAPASTIASATQRNVGSRTRSRDRASDHFPGSFEAHSSHPCYRSRLCSSVRASRIGSTCEVAWARRRGVGLKRSFWEGKGCEYAAVCILCS